MNVHAIYHLPKSNYAFPVSENELCIRIRTAKNDFETVRLVYGVKYYWENRKTIEMKKILSNSLFDFYEYTICQTDMRIGYYFELIEGEETTYLYENGLESKKVEEEVYQHFFQFPYINAVDVHKIPTWVDTAIFYQIFPDRFYPGKEKINKIAQDDWNRIPVQGDCATHYGGTIKGIEEKLDYISQMGITALYLTPIFKSESNHKYDTYDYMDIDERFGTKEDFRNLVESAHKRGIHIVLDAVFNHCGYEFEPFQDVIKNGVQSKYKDWFVIDTFPVDTKNLNYRTFADVYSMPKLNTQNHEVKAYLLKVAAYWIEEFKIDGWRLDVSDEVDHEFWREFRKTVKKANPDAVIIGENWHDSRPWLLGDQFDSVMNYSVTTACVNYFAKMNADEKMFEEELTNAYLRNTKQVNRAMLNLLESHDTARFLSKCNEDIVSLKNAFLFIFAYVGMPCIYYGAEMGMVGEGDPVNRTAFNWDQSTWDQDLRDFFIKLIDIRKNHLALSHGEIEFLSTNQLFIMKREYEGETIFVVCNNSKKSIKLNGNLPVTNCEDLLTNKVITKDTFIEANSAQLLKII